MATRRKVNNLLALAVLSYLTQRPMHPYEVGRTLTNNGDTRSIKFNNGSLYMIFRQLAEAGLIVEVGTSRDGLRPERTTYTLTDVGRDELHDWMRELVAEPKHEYPHFVAALSLIAALGPGEVVELLRHRLERLEEERSTIRAGIDSTVAAGLHPLFQIEEEYRLALLDADTSFVQNFIERIDDPTNGWRDPWEQFLGQAVASDSGGPS